MAKTLDLMIGCDDFWFVQLVDTEPFTVNPWSLVDEYGNNLLFVFSNGDDARQYVIDAGLVGQCEATSAPPIPLLKFLVSAEKSAFYVLNHKHGQKIVAQEFHEFIWQIMGIVYVQGRQAGNLQKENPEAYDELVG